MLTDLEELLFQVKKRQNWDKYVTVSLKDSRKPLWKNTECTWIAEKFVLLEVSKIYDI